MSEECKLSGKIKQLSKQSEVEEDEEVHGTKKCKEESPVPQVTIDNVSQDSDDNGIVITCGDAGRDASLSADDPSANKPPTISRMEQQKSTDSDRSTSSQTLQPRLKLLTRGEAVRDDTSPPPEHFLQEPAENNQLRLSRSLNTSGSQSSFGSLDATSSPVLSRDSSTEIPYTDSTGVDLEEFIKMTINKNPRDRQMLLKLEQDLTQFIRDNKQPCIKFGPHSSYNRMLVHRIAAFFGLDHNIDQTGKCVVVNKTANTRIPDFPFEEQMGQLQDTSIPSSKHVVVKKIEQREKSLEHKLGHGRSLEGKKSKSIEERERDYNETRKRIFTAEQNLPDSMQSSISLDGSDVRIKSNSELHGRPWSSTESSGYGSTDGEKHNTFTKANSFSGSLLHRTDTKVSKHFDRNLQANSAMIRHPPIAPSPPAVNQAESLPLDCQSMVWVATPIDNVAPGSIIINPSTGQPFLNPDGSLYRHPASKINVVANSQNNDDQPLATQQIPDQPTQQVLPDQGACMQHYQQQAIQQQQYQMEQQFNNVMLSPQSSTEASHGVQPSQQLVHPTHQMTYYHTDPGMQTQPGMQAVQYIYQGQTNIQAVAQAPPGGPIQGQIIAPMPQVTMNSQQQVIRNGQQMTSLGSAVQYPQKVYSQEGFQTQAYSAVQHCGTASGSMQPGISSARPTTPPVRIVGSMPAGQYNYSQYSGPGVPGMANPQATLQNTQLVPFPNPPMQQVPMVRYRMPIQVPFNPSAGSPWPRHQTPDCAISIQGTYRSPTVLGDHVQPVGAMLDNRVQSPPQHCPSSLQSSANSSPDTVGSEHILELSDIPPTASKQDLDSVMSDLANHGAVLRNCFTGKSSNRTIQAIFESHQAAQISLDKLNSTHYKLHFSSTIKTVINSTS